MALNPKLEVDRPDFQAPLKVCGCTTLAAARAQGAVVAYGNFTTVLINFLILAWIILLMVKGVNYLRHQVEHHEKTGATPPTPHRQTSAC